MRRVANERPQAGLNARVDDIAFAAEGLSAEQTARELGRSAALVRHAVEVEARLTLAPAKSVVLASDAGTLTLARRALGDMAGQPAGMARRLG
eukprot:10113024-Lingulodinium_polyedra.AAC.1